MDNDADDIRHPEARPLATSEAGPKSRFLFLWLVLASLFSLGGVAAFILLFVRDMTVYWFILSPLIIIVYQFPAFVVFRIWKRKRGMGAAPAAPASGRAEDAEPKATDEERYGMPDKLEKG